MQVVDIKIWEELKPRVLHARLKGYITGFSGARRVQTGEDKESFKKEVDEILAGLEKCVDVHGEVRVF